jgi:hypothetical protein
MTHGLMQSDAAAAERLQPFPDKCRPTAEGLSEWRAWPRSIRAEKITPVDIAGY